MWSWNLMICDHLLRHALLITVLHADAVIYITVCGAFGTDIGRTFTRAKLAHENALNSTRFRGSYIYLIHG